MLEFIDRLDYKFNGHLPAGLRLSIRIGKSYNHYRATFSLVHTSSGEVPADSVAFYDFYKNFNAIPKNNP
jgi:hypothetical protein